MAKCEFCGEESGFLRKKHEECQQRHNYGIERILNLAQNSVFASSPLDYLEKEINQVMLSSFVSKEQMKQLLIQAWENSVNSALDDDSISQEEENSLVAFRDFFSLSNDDLDSVGAYSKLVKAAVLRDLLEGKIPDRVKISNNIPFNFQKGETVIWLFNGVEYFEEKSRRQYVGGSQGINVRVAKGLYYRVGSFRGHPVSTSETVYVDTGILVVTNKNIYFAGQSKVFKVAFNKIVAITPNSDGVGIQRDGTTAKPQYFVTGDGWFTYNLMMNVTRLNAG